MVTVCHLSSLRSQKISKITGWIYPDNQGSDLGNQLTWPIAILQPNLDTLDLLYTSKRSKLYLGQNCCCLRQIPPTAAIVLIATPHDCNDWSSLQSGLVAVLRNYEALILFHVMRSLFFLWWTRKFGNYRHICDIGNQLKISDGWARHSEVHLIHCEIRTEIKIDAPRTNFKPRYGLFQYQASCLDIVKSIS